MYFIIRYLSIQFLNTQEENAMTALSIYFIFSMLAVIYFDATRYIIPNWLIGSMLVLYPVALYFSPEAVDWKMALAGMGIVFAVGYVLFAKGWMGGGDIKLITACALWVGWEKLPDFIVLFALFGGLLSVLLVILRKIAPHITKRRGDALPRMLQEKAPVPYGLAIAVGFLMLMSRGEIALLSL
jgi:prepilin peptidase CpaA